MSTKVLESRLEQLSVNDENEPPHTYHKTKDPKAKVYIY